ncbi:hypothetical protein [Streptomyces canus]|uniref:hypothetical protein n=1 Tax=Streptomyces canus TaxID=58343 RepID=UPI0037241363
MPGLVRRFVDPSGRPAAGTREHARRPAEGLPKVVVGLGIVTVAILGQDSEQSAVCDQELRVLHQRFASPCKIERWGDHLSKNTSRSLKADSTTASRRSSFVRTRQESTAFDSPVPEAII